MILVKSLSKAGLPLILFVVSVSDKEITLTPSPIFSAKDLKVVSFADVSDSRDFDIRLGDKILAYESPSEKNVHIVFKRILARGQPFASSTEEYLKKLHVHVYDKDQQLDIQELNGIIQNVLGTKIEKAEADCKDWNVLVRLSETDPGTRDCPFILFFLNKPSFPFEIDLPKVSFETMEYLKKVYPNETQITETRIFAVRLIHFLLHASGYLEHTRFSPTENEKIVEAIKEGNPALVPPLDPKKLCFNSWQHAHFIAADPGIFLEQVKRMICKECRRSHLQSLKLPSFEDLQKAISVEGSRRLITKSLKSNSKEILYVVGAGKEGIILSFFPYVSNRTVNLSSVNWFPSNDLGQNLVNIFVPKNMFSDAQRVREGDKFLANIATETHSEEKLDFHVEAKEVTALKVLSRNVPIIDPQSLRYRFRPFRLGLALKIGPEIEDSYIRKVARTVERITGWRVWIDKSSYENLKLAYEEVSIAFRDWKDSDLCDRGKCVARVNRTIEGLAKKRDVEDRFEVPVFVFPDRFKFFGDVLGGAFSGEAVDRTFAVVHTWPKRYYPYEESCRACKARHSYPFGEIVTSLVIIHEVMHIASGLGDHQDCSICRFDKDQMRPLRRFHCEDCIRKHNNKAVENCLMNGRCIECIASRMSKDKLFDILCERCRRKLFPPDEFAIRQAARMNYLLYWKTLTLGMGLLQ